eukprot:SAG25_NODE_6438_length_559_cov_1.904348_1_plen_167_part_01
MLETHQGQATDSCSAALARPTSHQQAASRQACVGVLTWRPALSAAHLLRHISVMPRAAAPPAVAALLPPPAPSSHRPHPPPWGAALCDRLCFASSVSALAERATAAAEGTRPLLSLPRCPPPAHEPTRRDVLHLAWPHAVWLLLGCVALACRLPFSLAMPHLISEVI